MAEYWSYIMSYVIYINRGIYFGSSGYYNLAYEVRLLDKWVPMFIWLCECPLWLNVCHGKHKENKSHSSAKYII